MHTLNPGQPNVEFFFDRGLRMPVSVKVPFDNRLALCEVVGMKDGRYHKLLGLPAGAAQLWAGQLNLRWGHHAQKEADADRYGRAEQFSHAEFHASDIVEVTVENGSPVWGVARFPYSDDLDLVMVLGAPVRGEAFVKTVWFNKASDHHKSLDRSKYNRP